MALRSSLLPQPLPSDRPLFFGESQPLNNARCTGCQVSIDAPKVSRWVLVKITTTGSRRQDSVSQFHQFRGGSVECLVGGDPRWIAAPARSETDVEIEIAVLRASGMPLTKSVAMLCILFVSRVFITRCAWAVPSPTYMICGATRHPRTLRIRGNASLGSPHTSMLSARRPRGSSHVIMVVMLFSALCDVFTGKDAVRMSEMPMFQQRTRAAAHDDSGRREELISSKGVGEPGEAGTGQCRRTIWARLRA